MTMAKIERIPPPPPEFNKAEFYTERITKLLDDADAVLSDVDMEEVITEIGMELQRWLKKR